jgi:hypothetical protein
MNAAAQFQLGFDVRGAFEKRKRRKRVALGTPPDEAPDTPPSMEPP